MPCNNYTLTLTGGGVSVKASDPPPVLTAQVRCNGQPAQGVSVEIKATPVNPPTGPAGGLRAAGGSGSGVATVNATTNPAGEIRLDFVAPAQVQTFDVLHHVTARCTDPTKPCTPNPTDPEKVTVKGCPITLSLQGGGQVEPNGLLPDQILRATNCDGELVEELAVEIKSSVQADTGGHQHHNNDRPKGTINASRSTTNENGEIPFSFKAPQVAGTHNITARCATNTVVNCNEASPIPVDVKVEDLASLANGLYVIEEIGQTQEHPSNHFLRADASKNLRKLAIRYAKTTDQFMYINDASLIWGGLFDVGCVKESYVNQGRIKYRCQQPVVLNPWMTPHKEHRCGIAVDIRGNGNTNEGAIPPEDTGMFTDMAEKLGIGVLPEITPPHFHLFLLGEDLQEDNEIMAGTKTCKQLLGE